VPNLDGFDRRFSKLFACECQTFLASLTADHLAEKFHELLALALPCAVPGRAGASIPSADLALGCKAWVGDAASVNGVF
jgi:hypothetical protein